MATGARKSFLPLDLRVPQPGLPTHGWDASRMEQWMGFRTQRRPGSIADPDRVDLPAIDDVPYCEEGADK